MAVAVRSRAEELFGVAEGVVGQARARKQLAVLLDRQIAVAGGDHTQAAGAILAGPSGSGKTYMAKLMCSACGLPFAETNATRYTEAGYAGLDLQQMFLPLIEAAALQYDRQRHAAPYAFRFHGRESSVLKRPDIAEVVKLAETGVVLLDEFDKWMLRVNHVTGQQDKAIQADLLKMVEGSIEYISDEEDEVGIPFDTSRVLILCAGAFVNLARQVRKRLDKSEDDLGSESFWDLIEPEDFERFGLIPELAGRLSTHIFTRALSVGDLSTILAAEASPLWEYRRRFEALGCEWGVEEGGVVALAAQAQRRGTGARGIDFVLWRVFSEALFTASQRAGRVTFSPEMHRAQVR